VYSFNYPGANVARKRKSGLLQNVFELVAMLPWWIGVLTAIGLYLGLHLYASQPVAPATTKTQIASSISTTFFVTVAGVLQYVLPLVCLAAAAASAWRASKRKSLVQGVTSSRSAASLDAMTWQEFELLVGAAFRQKGYKVTELGGAGPDGGVDLLLVKGGETTLVQCKQWKAFKVGVDVVRALYSVMAAKGAANGIVVTSGVFTKDAQDFARGRNVTLLAGEALFAMLQAASKRPPIPVPHLNAAAGCDRSRQSGVVGLPAVRQQFVDPTGALRWQPRKDILQIGVRVVSIHAG